MNTNSKIIREILRSIPSVDQLVQDCYDRIDIQIPYPYLKKIITNQVSQLRKEVNAGLHKSDISKNISEYIIDSVRLKNHLHMKPVMLRMIFGC